jgi:NADPH-ferrihemoprotein reductase
LGESFELITAFSRESAKKVYVQHKIKEREDEILALLDQGAFVYVCGDASKMAKEVNETLVDIWARGKGVPHEEAHELLKDFKTTNRYQEDVW